MIDIFLSLSKTDPDVRFERLPNNDVTDEAIQHYSYRAAHKATEAVYGQTPDYTREGGDLSRPARRKVFADFISRFNSCDPRLCEHFRSQHSPSTRRARRRRRVPFAASISCLTDGTTGAHSMNEKLDTDNYIRVRLQIRALISGSCECRGPSCLEHTCTSWRPSRNERTR